MKILTSLLSLLICSVSFAADIVGTWRVQNLSESMLEEQALEQFFSLIADEYASSEYKADLIFGVLGNAKQIQFKANGKFYCNESVYGTYTFKDDKLLLKRDKKLVESFEKSIKKTLELSKKTFDKEDRDRFAIDSLLISFSKKGNKALVESNQSLEELVFFPFGVGFVLVKEGTQGASEDLNYGKSVIGRWNLSLLGMVTLTYDFKEGGVLELTKTDIMTNNSESYSMTYSFKDDHIICSSDNDEGSKEYEYFIGKNSLMLYSKENRLTTSLWKEK